MCICVSVCVGGSGAGGFHLIRPPHGERERLFGRTLSSPLSDRKREFNSSAVRSGVNLISGTEKQPFYQHSASAQ